MRVRGTLIFGTIIKMGCVFPRVIWPGFGQYRDNYHSFEHSVYLIGKRHYYVMKSSKNGINSNLVKLSD